MSVLFDILYHEYCRARLAEMRSQLLLTESREAPKRIAMLTTPMALLIWPG
jgi:hypothetical protein